MHHKSLFDLIDDNHIQHKHSKFKSYSQHFKCLVYLLLLSSLFQLVNTQGREEKEGKFY